MRALLYVSKRGIVNRIRKALKKPVTYLFLLLGAAYAGIILYGWGMLISQSRFDSVVGLVAILTVWTYFIFCSNFISYAKRKGIIFKPSHAHFIFTAPVSPKVILLYAAMKNFFVSFLGSAVFTLGALTIFRVSLLRSLALFFFMFVFEIILEGSLIVCLYANERLPEKAVRLICKLIWVFVGSILCIGIFYFRTYGFSLKSAAAFIDFPALQLIPLVGWNVAAFRLILYGATTMNIVGTALYLISVSVMAAAAYRMKCTGGYYEEAAKFADDYIEFKAKSKSGEAVFSIGKKKKFNRKATVKYKGTGAKAIFYRQFLEYRKEKWFIFSFMTILSIAAAIFMIKGIGASEEPVLNVLKLLGVLAYVALISSGYVGKWEKELKSPYLYLLPDTPFRKLWYATLMEHVKSFVDGCIMAVPVGIAWKLPVLQIIFAVVVYMALQANRLYTKIFVEAVLGDTFGETIKKILRPMASMGIIVIGFVIAGIVGIFLNAEFVFPIVIIYSMMSTVVVALLASMRFDRMEQME